MGNHFFSKKGFIMQKQQEYKIADTNLALFGSDVEKKLKRDAAATEKAWKGAGQKVGLKIWRVKEFELLKVPRYEHGEFYENDSYIVLSTYKADGSDKLQHDVHIWIGRTSTADEYGTAAYKMQELDHLLHDEPVQHRNIADHESHLFLSYFAESGGIRILEGGYATGFNHVEPTEYRPRLLQLKGKKYVRCSEVPLSASSLNSGDCFILDAGLTLFQWNGDRAGIREKGRATQLTRALDDERRGKPQVSVQDQGSEDPEFWEALGGKGDVAEHEPGSDEAWEVEDKHVLFRISDETGAHEFTKEAEGKVSRDLLKSDDSYVYDAGHELFVWVGKDSSREEHKYAMQYAQDYLVQNDRPHWLPLSLVHEGGENAEFEQLFVH